MTFATKYNRPVSKPEFNDGQSKTETAGYVPPKVQIEQMIMAGYRLNQYRQEAYDFKDGDDVGEDVYDPTRGPNFDLADASMLAEKARQGLNKARQKAKEEAEEKKKLEDLEKKSDKETK